MSRQRVCVIGGGPAGLAAALEGARLGLQVDLLDAHEIGSNIRCAEGFFDSLNLLGKPQAGVRFKVREAIVDVEREYRVDCGGIHLWMIDRGEWQRYLAGQARAAGVRITEKSRVTAERLRELEQEYDWVIDASGIPPVTSLALGFKDYYHRYGAVTAQYVMEGGFEELGNRLKFIFFPHYTGYGWIFPKGRDEQGRLTANVGIGYFPGGEDREKQRPNPWDELNRLLVKEQIRGLIVRHYGGWIPLRLRQRLRYGKILLVGDAAGCASPLHGGGIDTAYLTGQLAARWIARGQREDFAREVWRLLGRKLEVEQRLCRLWAQMDTSTLDGFIGLVMRDFRQSGIPRFGQLRLFLNNLATLIRFRSGLLKGKW